MPQTSHFPKSIWQKTPFPLLTLFTFIGGVNYPLLSQCVLYNPSLWLISQWNNVLCILIYSIPNATGLFDLSPLPLIGLHPPTYNSSDTLGSHSHLKSHHPSNQSFIFPLAIFPSLPILIFSNGGNSCSESQLWSWSGRSIFFLFLPAHLHCTSTRMDLMAATPTPLSALQ